MREHPDGGWVLPHVTSSISLSALLFSFPLLFFSAGAPSGGQRWPPSVSPGSKLPSGPLFLWPGSVRLSSQPLCSSALSINPPFLPPPVPRGLAAVLNTQKCKAFTYITLAVQLMSWCVSAVWWCQSCLERQRACWVGQCVKSYSCTEPGE